jgi:hypothetical protein
MTLVAEPETTPETIEATVNYLLSTDRMPMIYGGEPGSAQPRTSLPTDSRRVVIRNGRVTADQFALDRNGFRLVCHNTQMHDFFDEDEVRRVYYPEMEALVKAETGASRVIVFNHFLRSTNANVRATRKVLGQALSVHNDYTESSGPERVRKHFPEETKEPSRRSAIVQVWRPIHHPVEMFPLAVCDAKSLMPEDLVVTERHSTSGIGVFYTATYNPHHRWYWFPRMRRDEALVFKVYDSVDDGRARWTPHTAFEDPLTPPHACPRESIEIRAVAVF